MSGLVTLSISHKIFPGSCSFEDDTCGWTGEGSGQSWERLQGADHTRGSELIRAKEI